ncbi:MAG: Holliday junction resolvase RuvX [Planctomycetota bacterium]|nr:Holliday junction resolvase RuvX [Phycisphaerales bacterium]MEC8250017.1 Holliday junction resolvase RuvX [Planctomycetota bacterium]MEC8385592.1 Holliday junction resolvase RuvX [Planctomycetota bacterium]
MLGIDLGGKRTGLAFAETLSGLVMPIEVLHASEGPALDSALDNAIREHGPHRLVVGLPLNMDGTEGPAAQKSRAMGENLQQRHGLPVEYQDERLTSFAAEADLAERKLNRRAKKNVADAHAAAEILRDWLAEQS